MAKKKHPDQEFHDYLLYDVFGTISGITSRAMFSGFGFYKNGVIFSIFVAGTLYFKVGDNNRKDYENAGSHPFTYEQGNHKKVTVSYYTIPEEILSDPDELKQWIEKSLEAHLQKTGLKKRKSP